MQTYCEDGQRLRDAYLKALSAVSAIQLRNRTYSHQELQYACDELVAARRRYWTHVRRHKCRKVCGSAVSLHSE
jgi:hypothetical protein